MNYYFTFGSQEDGRRLVTRLAHKGISASLRPVKNSPGRWTVFGSVDLPAVEIEPLAFGLRYLYFKAQED